MSPDGTPISPGSGATVYTDVIAVALTGTVAKAGTTAVVGTGTAFLSQVAVGMVIRIPGTASEDRIVASITDDTHLTTTVAFANTASSQTISVVMLAQRMKPGYGADASFTDVDPNHGLPVAASQLAAASAAWTSATSLNAANTVSTIGLSQVVVSFAVTTNTLTAGALTFEVFDGTNWISIAGVQVNSWLAQSTYSINLGIGALVAWEFDVGGFQQFRVRLSTVLTGSGTGTVLVQGQAGGSEPSVATGPTNDLFASGAIAGVNQAVTLATQGAPFAMLTIPALTGTIVLEGDPGTGTYQSLYMSQIFSAGNNFDNSNSLVNPTGSNPRWIANISGYRSIRLRCSAYTSGSGTFTIIASSAPFNSSVPETSNLVNGDPGTLSGLAKGGMLFVNKGNGTLGWMRGGFTGDGNALTGILNPLGLLYNGSTADFIRSIINGTNSTGTGIQAVGLVAQLDDVSPTVPTENQFTNLRETADRALHVALKLDTLNGGTLNRIKAAASTNATSVKASAGMIYKLFVRNNAAYDVFLKLYNKASAPTVGTDTPVATIPIPAGGGIVDPSDMGLPFGTGIAYAITKLVADTDTTAVVAEDVHGYMLTR